MREFEQAQRAILEHLNENRDRARIGCSGFVPLKPHADADLENAMLDAFEHHYFTIADPKAVQTIIDTEGYPLLLREVAEKVKSIFGNPAINSLADQLPRCRDNGLTGFDELESFLRMLFRQGFEAKLTNEGRRRMTQFDRELEDEMARKKPQGVVQNVQVSGGNVNVTAAGDITQTVIHQVESPILELIDAMTDRPKEEREELKIGALAKIKELVASSAKLTASALVTAVTKWLFDKLAGHAQK